MNRKNTKFIFLAIIFFVFFGRAENSEAATKYIRAGATGTGSGNDWTNAYATFSAAGLTGSSATTPRGNTYYVADGSYAGGRFQCANSGTAPIVIKKATMSDHGPAGDWDSSYGDGQAALTSTIQIMTDYWEFRGNHAFDGWASTSTSFGFTAIAEAEWQFGILIDGSGAAHRAGIVIENFYIDMELSEHAESKSILMDNVDAFTISNCYLRSWGDAIAAYGAGGWTIEYNYFTRAPSNEFNASDHGDGIVIQRCDTGNVVIRNNDFNWSGQQIFLEDSANPSAEWDALTIYGNVFRDSTGTYAGQLNFKNMVIGDVSIYNNSFHGLTYPLRNQNDTYTGTAKNNVYFDCSFVPGFGTTIAHDYNYYETDKGLAENHGIVGGEPFVSAASGNLALSDALDGDGTIGAAYNTDRLGNARGADGVWDIGAFEFVSGGDATPPAAPQGLGVQ